MKLSAGMSVIKTVDNESLYVCGRIEALLKAGIAFIDGIEINAKTSTGVVSFGCQDRPFAARLLENYLSEHPTPDTW